MLGVTHHQLWDTAPKFSIRTSKVVLKSFSCKGVASTHHENSPLCGDTWTLRSIPIQSLTSLAKLFVSLFSQMLKFETSTFSPNIDRTFFRGMFSLG